MLEGEKVNNIIEYLQLIKYSKLIKGLLLTPLLMGNSIDQKLLRIILRNGIYEKIEKKYSNKITKNYQNPTNNDFNNIIWFMWFQPIENAPMLVQKNYEYLKRQFGKQLILVNNQNFTELTQMPDFILEKFQQGKISKTHLSDIIRVQLLSLYGGTWIDSTVIITKEKFNSLPDTVIFQQFSPSGQGVRVTVSSWFLKFSKGNLFIRRVRDLLFDYWETENKLVDYFLLHQFIQIASKEFGNYLSKIYPFENSIPHYTMLKMRNENMSKEKIKALVMYSGVSKFTNKHRNEVEVRNYKILEEIINDFD